MFWLWIMFNLLSWLCTWLMRSLPLSTGGLLLVGAVALLNVGFGLLAAWALVRDAPAPPVFQGAGVDGLSASTSTTSE